MLDAGALLHLGRVASVLGVAATVREAKIVERLFPANRGAQDRDDFRTLIVPIRKVEAQRPLASAAIVPVAMTQCIEPLRNLLTPVSPWCDVTDDDAAHGRIITAGTYRPVSEQA